MQTTLFQLWNKSYATNRLPNDWFLIANPIAFLIFNRPEHTQKVFDINRSFRPSRLFVAADGHSLYVSNDAGKFAAARMVVKQVDWNSDVRLSIRERICQRSLRNLKPSNCAFLMLKRNYSGKRLFAWPFTLFIQHYFVGEIQNRFRCYANQQE